MKAHNGVFHEQVDPYRHVHQLGKHAPAAESADAVISAWRHLQAGCPRCLHVKSVQGSQAGHRGWSSSGLKSTQWPPGNPIR